ncbi:MAG: hypothetical protein WCV79_01345 [Candidatus Paceibacterota bacterium]|jgi:hypothetical protein
MKKDTSRDINLQLYFSEQRSLEINIEQVSANLKKAIDELASLKHTRAEEVRGLLKAGRTTSDALSDEAVQRYGIDRQVIESIRHFNSKLMTNKDQKLLVVVEYQYCWKHVMFSRENDDNQYRTARGYVCGILTGERLELPPDGSVILPFSRHVIRGLPENENRDVSLGRLTVTNFFSNKFNPDTILSGIIQSVDHIPSLLNSPHSERQTTILIGEEITDESIYQTGLLAHVKNLDKILSTPTPEEKIAGESI